MHVLTWDEYLDDLDLLRDRVRAACLVTAIGATCVDGVMPAIYLAHQLGVEFMSGPHLANARLSGHPVLSVAGYVPPGDPEGKLWGLSSKNDPRSRVAVLYAGERLPTEPDIVIRRVDERVVFPYERPR